MMTEMKCKICKRDLPIENFRKQPKNKSGYEYSCRKCRASKYYEKNREKRIKQGLLIRFPTLAGRKLMEEGKKYCPTCKQILDLTEFSTTKKGTGVASHCKEFQKIWREKYKNDHPERKQIIHKNYKKQRERWIRDGLRKNFGMTYDEYKNLLETQGGKCAICSKTPKENKKMLGVDHDHKTNKVRGILCSTCNQGIGLFHDNIEHLANAIKYLNTTKA